MNPKSDFYQYLAKGTITFLLIFTRMTNLQQ